MPKSASFIFGVISICWSLLESLIKDLCFLASWTSVLSSSCLRVERMDKQKPLSGILPSSKSGKYSSRSSHSLIKFHSFSTLSSWYFGTSSNLTSSLLNAYSLIMMRFPYLLLSCKQLSEKKNWTMLVWR